MKRHTHEFQTDKGAFTAKLLPDTARVYKEVRKWDRESNKYDADAIREKGDKAREKAVLKLQKTKKYKDADSVEQAQMTKALVADMLEDFFDELEEKRVQSQFNFLRRIVDYEALTDEQISLLETDLDGEFWESQDVQGVQETIARFRERSNPIRVRAHRMGQK